jgi:ribulose-bisphosphate carboxylase large chain
MVNIENWVAFPEEVKIPIVTCNLYEAYGFTLPDLKLIDEKLRKRFGPYIFEDPSEFNFEEIRQKNIIMYISVSPKLKEGETVEYGLLKATLDIAAEESTGSWDPDLKTILPGEMDTDSEENMRILQAKVIGLNFKTGMGAIALPKEGFEYGNIPQLLSVVVGNYTGMTSVVWGVRLDDIDFPDDYADSFEGPLVGNEGIKKLMGDEITIGTIVKPKTGLSEEDWAKTAKRSYLAGLNVVKDDENLTSQEYCKFEKRVELVYKAIAEVEEETGRTLMMVPNITHGDINEMIRRGKLVEKLKGNCLMIDILACGITAVQTIRKEFPKMVLHGHRAGHGAQTIFPEVILDGKKYEFRHGISMKVWSLISRLAGIDQLHIGAPKGKMEATYQTVLENLEACNRPLGKIKPCRAICSGGLKATVMWDVASIMNPIGDDPNIDIIFQAGAGSHSHDLGTPGGSRSLAQARDAVMAGISKFKAISNNFELLLAFRKWEPETYYEWLKSLNKDSKIVIQPDERPYYAKGKEKGEPPKSVSLKEAIEIYPKFESDLEEINPELLKSL